MTYWLYLTIFLVLAYWASMPFIEIVMRQCVRSNAEEKTAKLFGLAVGVLAFGLFIHATTALFHTGSFSTGYEWGYKVGLAVFAATVVQLIVARRVREAETDDEDDGPDYENFAELCEQWERRWRKMRDRQRSLEIHLDDMRTDFYRRQQVHRITGTLDTRTKNDI